MKYSLMILIILFLSACSNSNSSPNPLINTKTHNKIQAVDKTSGNDHGNGGGVICINNKCQSLADSGLVVSAQYPDFWIPSEQALKNVSNFIDRMPLPKYLRTRILNHALMNLTHFKAVEVVDQVKLDSIRQLYIETLKITSPDFDTTNFKIVAISSDDSDPDQNTFILPDFFKLDDEQQAKILIHEGFYRGRPSLDLKYILQLESALKIFYGKTQGLKPADIRKDLVSVQIAAYNLNFLNKSEAFATILQTTFSNMANVYSGDTRGYFDPEELSKNELIFDWFLKSNIDVSADAYPTDWNYKENNLFSQNLDSSGNINLKDPSVTINHAFILKRSNLDSRTTVMLLNLGNALKMKYYDSHFSEYCIENVGTILHLAQGRAYQTFADPQNLNLLLPK